MVIYLVCFRGIISLAGAFFFCVIGGYPTHRIKDVLRKRYSRIVIPSEAEGSFLHTGIALYVRQWKRGTLLRKEQERAECKEDFSTALEMTVWGDG